MRILLQTDASLKRYKGQAFQSYGFMAHHSGMKYEGCGARVSNTGSSSVFEAMAAVVAVESIIDRYNGEIPRVYIRWLCDNQPLVQAVNKESRIKSPELLVVIEQLQALQQRYPVSIEAKWVPREQNKDSDHLARRALMMLIGQPKLWSVADEWIRFS